MTICVFGLGHLGSILAACLSEHHDVVGADPERAELADFHEPGLEMFSPALTTDVARAVASADLVWLADDTPVDEDDRADVSWVLDRARVALANARDGAVVVVSSQLPAGSVARLEREFPHLHFACLPENLRLGRAVETFRNAERYVVGARNDLARGAVEEALAPYDGRIVWMSVESAELTKHALNAFLATSVAFANEIAGVCEAIGGDARDVEAGLRSDPRVGEQAYVSAGPPFGGGTLARDVQYLRGFAHDHGLGSALLDGVVAANDAHRGWTRRHLEASGARTVAIWGLAYKPGTNSTRRSEAVALVDWLRSRGVEVRTHDPAAPSDANDPESAAIGADAVVVAVAWPEYAEVDPSVLSDGTLVLDPTGLVERTLGADARLRYRRVGR